MAAQQLPSAYSLSGLSNVFPIPIVAQAAPTSSDFAQIGQVWVNVLTGDAYMLTMIASNSASWDQINQGSSGVFTSITVTPGDLTVTNGNIRSTLGTIRGHTMVSDDNLIVSSGDLFVLTGGVDASSGVGNFASLNVVVSDLVVTSGDLFVQNGNAEVTNGDLTIGAGDLLMTSGNIICSSGIITAGAGLVVVSSDMVAENGNAIAVNPAVSAVGPELQMRKIRNGAIITSGDSLGVVDFEGWDGTGYVSGGTIEVVSTGTIGVNRIPGNMVFSTHPDSASSLTPRMAIDPAGNVSIAAPDSGVGLSILGGGLTATPSTVSGNTTTQILNAYVGKVTTTGLTTASAASVTLTVTNSTVTAISPILVSVSTLGTNDAQLTVTRIKPGTGTFDVTLVNNGAQAVNGDIIMTFWVVS